MTPEQLEIAKLWTGYTLTAAAFLGMAVFFGRRFKHQVFMEKQENKVLTAQEKDKRWRKLGTAVTISVLGIILMLGCSG